MKTFLATAATATLLATTGHALVLQQPTITTIPDQNSTASSWGAGPATEIFGQTFTMTSDATLTGFDFLINDTGTAMDFNAYVYAWDGQNTSGSALYSGTGSTIGYNGLANLTINASAALTSGQHYIAYLEATDPGFATFGSVVGSDAYTGGEFVYQDLGSKDVGRVFTPWVGDVQGPNWDLAFAIRTDVQVAAVPIAPALPLLATALGAIGLMRRRKS